MKGLTSTGPRYPFNIHPVHISLGFLFFLAVFFFLPAFSPGYTFYPFDILYRYLPWSSKAPGFVVHNPLISDPVNQHYLSYQFLEECLSQRTLPLWYDPLLCGLPFFPGFTPQTNPVVLAAHLFFSLTTAHDVVLFLFMFGTGLFMLLYLRQLGVGNLSAVIGAVSWMFNGYIMVWFEFEFHVILSCSLPASLFFLERWLRERRLLDILLFTAAVCLAISSGMAHLLVYQLLFTGIYLPCRYLSLRKSPAAIRAMGRLDFLALTLSMILGLAVSGPMLSGYFTFFDDPQRADWSFRSLFAQTGQLHPVSLLTMIFPDLFGNPAGMLNRFQPTMYSTQIYNNYNELCLYAGILPLFLASASWPFQRRRPLVGFFLIVALYCLTAAMGSLLYYPLARFVPGLAYSTPTRILYLFGFAVSVLAALGSDMLRQGLMREKKTHVLATWTFLFLITAAVYQAAQHEAPLRWVLSLSPWMNWQNLVPIFRAHLVPWSSVLLDPLLFSGLTFLFLLPGVVSHRRRLSACFLALAAVLMAYDLISFGRHYNTVSSTALEFPATGAIEYLKQDKSKYRVIAYDNFLHNSLAAFGIDDIGGYVSVYPKRYGEFLHLSQNGPDAPLPEHFYRATFFHTFGSPLIDLLNTKYVLTPVGMPVHIPSLKRVYRDEITVYENQKAFPRAFFVPGYFLASDRKDAFQALGRFTHEDFKTRVILEKRPPDAFPSGPSIAPGTSQAPVTILSHLPNRVEIRVRSPARGFLVLGDSYSPGWRVQVDGRSAEVFRANYIMRAVPLEAGDHHVVFSYRPRLLLAGLAAGALGWLTIFSFVVVLLARKRQGPARQT